MSKLTTKMLSVSIALSITSAAYATDILPLADPLVGHWCPIKNGTDRVYKRGVWECEGNLLIRQDSYATDENSCRFSDVRRLPNGYTVRVNCAEERTERRMRFRIVGGLLYLLTLDNLTTGRTCTTVVHDNMPDGFLNLRAGPGTQHVVKARLV